MENKKALLVFSHSSYLMNMFNAVLDFEVEGNQTMQDVDDLKKWFNTWRILPVKSVSFGSCTSSNLVQYLLWLARI